MKRLPSQLKTFINQYISADISKGYYDILSRKMVIKEQLESRFANFKSWAMEAKREKLKDEFSL